jgi:hypothetical protein
MPDAIDTAGPLFHGSAALAAPSENRIARKNRSARGTAIGDYHSHEHSFATHIRIRERFRDARVAHDVLDRHA